MDSNDFLLTDSDTDESIILPYSIALELKKSVKTGGGLVTELYRLYGTTEKWKGILDRNLKKSSGIEKRNRQGC